jgi:hypothetical protein
MELHNCIYYLTNILRRTRRWHYREQTRDKMHPAIYAAISHAKPDNWHQLILEWPRQSSVDVAQIAYTRDEKYGEADRQLRTTVSKYLTRHFSNIPSNIIRDISAKYVNGKFKFVHTMAEMLNVIINGPSSCMGGKDADYFHDNHHPYEAYDPALGWHMAVYQEADGSFSGRALCNGMTYVRTYRASSSTYSQTDDRLVQWLQEQGYAKECGWSGFKLKRIPVRNNSGFLVPYLDGDDKGLTDDMTIVDSNDSDAVWRCDNTDGTADEIHGQTCEDCAERIGEDDGYWTGRCEDHLVCDCCLENNYSRVYGRRGDQYYVHNDDAVCVNDTYYDCHYLSDNNIVELHDGDYAHTDDAVYIDRDSEWRLTDDCTYCEHSNEYEVTDECVQLHDNEWAHQDDAFLCEHSDEWYIDDIEIKYETQCGKTVHIDYADLYTTEQLTLTLE